MDVRTCLTKIAVHVNTRHAKARAISDGSMYTQHVDKCARQVLMGTLRSEAMLLCVRRVTRREIYEFNYCLYAILYKYNIARTYVLAFKINQTI